MFDEAHVVAGLDARHGEERHALAGAVQRAGPRAVGDSDLRRAVGRPLPVTVHLCDGQEVDRLVHAIVI